MTLSLVLIVLIPLFVIPVVMLPQNKLKFFTFCALAGTALIFVLEFSNFLFSSLQIRVNIGKAFYPMFAFFAYRPYLSLEECYDLSFLFTMLFFYGICYFATFLILKRIHIGSNPNIRKPSSIISTIFDTVIFLVCTYGVLAIFLIDIRIILPLGDGFLGWLFQLIHPLKA